MVCFRQSGLYKAELYFYFYGFNMWISEGSGNFKFQAADFFKIDLNIRKNLLQN